MLASYYYYVPFLAPLILMARRWALPESRPLFWALSATLLICFVGLRSEVGGDWHIYSGWVDDARSMSPIDAFLFTDPGYGVVNWIGANTFGGVYFVNFICALLAIIPLFYFCSKQEDPVLALFVSIPYLVVVVFMGYTRQGVAIGFGMMAILAIQRRDTVAFLFWVTFASLFHRSAAVFFAISPALYLPYFDRKVLARLVACSVYAAVLTALLFRGSAIHMAQQYIVATGDGVPAISVQISPPSDTAPNTASSDAAPNPASSDAAPNPASSDTAPNTVSGEAVEGGAAGLHSAGAIFRLLQSVAAVAAFAIIATRRKLSGSAFWLWTIISSIVMSLFLLSFWRSTLADRSALFFIPIQLLAFSTLPLVLPAFWRGAARASVVIASVASLWVWLNFGHNASAWLPYRNILLP